MKQWKRLLYYLAINVIVSACTTLVVLSLWDRGRAPASSQAAETQPRTGATSEVGEAAPAVEDGSPVAPAITALAFVVTATPTPAVTPLPPSIEYEVLADDTLGEIAERYDLTIADIIAINQLEDPNRLEVGQIILIPATPGPDILAIVEPTNTSAPLEENPGAEGTPVETEVAAQEAARVIIRNVFGVGDLTTERVFLQRTGDGELDLSGWELRDEDGNVFAFPALRMFEDGAVHVWTTSGAQTVVDLYWGQTGPVWSVGETVTLFDAAGNSHATFTIP